MQPGLPLSIYDRRSLRGLPLKCRRSDNGAFPLKIKEKHRDKRRAGKGALQLQGVIYF